MPRRARIVLQGHPHHVVQRAHRRQQIFTDEADCLPYLNDLQRERRRLQVAVYAWCLMPNHVHLLLALCMTAVRCRRSWASWRAEPVGGSITGMACPVRCGSPGTTLRLSERKNISGVLPIHRTESRTRRHRGQAGTIPMVQLSRSDAGPGRRGCASRLRRDFAAWPARFGRVCPLRAGGYVAARQSVWWGRVPVPAGTGTGESAGACPLRGRHRKSAGACPPRDRHRKSAGACIPAGQAPESAGACPLRGQAPGGQSIL